MDQNNNNNQSMNNNPGAGEKTFTQEQLNAILGERLAKEKAKSEAALAEREKDLLKRELRMTAREKIKAAGLSEDLIEFLDVSSEENIDKAIEAVKKAITDGESHYKPVDNNRLPTGDPWASADTPDRKLRKAMGLPIK